MAKGLQHLTESLEKMTSQFKDDLQSTAERLEGRINRDQENQDLLAAQMRRDQEKIPIGDMNFAWCSEPFDLTRRKETG